MVKIGIKEDEYFSELSLTQAAANRLKTKNGLDKPTKSLNVVAVDKLFSEYEQINKAIDAYAKLINYDLSRFKSVGENQIKLDKDFSK